MLKALLVDDNELLITFTDNGIELANSCSLKEKSEHKSHGMTLIRKCIAALSYFGG